MTYAAGSNRERKLLPGLQSPWDQELPIWELRVGEHRVFYDVQEQARVVTVRAIRRSTSLWPETSAPSCSCMAKDGVRWPGIWGPRGSLKWNRSMEAAEAAADFTGVGPRWRGAATMHRFFLWLSA